MPGVIINEITETEVNNLDSVELIVFGDNFFEGTKLYMDGAEFIVDEMTRNSLTTTLLPGISAGTKTITVEGATGSTASESLVVVEPSYLVKVYETEISLGAEEFYSLPFNIIGLDRFTGSAGFTLTGVPDGWDTYITDKDTAFLQGTIPTGTVAGVYTIELSADSGAVVNYSITVTETAADPVP